MSPLALPKELLHPWIDEILSSGADGALRDVLLQLKTRPTFQQQWPDSWQQGLKRGKARILELERIRQDTYTMSDILAERPDVLKWWESI